MPLSSTDEPREVDLDNLEVLSPLGFVEQDDRTQPLLGFVARGIELECFVLGRPSGRGGNDGSDAALTPDLTVEYRPIGCAGDER